MKTLITKLETIQKTLKAPKNQRNNFWNYNYRSLEDIMEAVKPLLNWLALVVKDEIVEVAGRIYVKATAILTDGENTIEVSAFAREAEHKKWMDEAQLTWATSSYARKYALNGLFAIDDTKDADTNEYNVAPRKENVAPKKPTDKERIQTAIKTILDLKKQLWQDETEKEYKEYMKDNLWDDAKDTSKVLDFLKAEYNLLKKDLK